MLEHQQSPPSDSSDSPDTSTDLENNSLSSNTAKKRKKRPWLTITGVILLVGLGSAGILWFNQRNSNNTPALASQSQATSVKLMTLETTTLQDTFEVVGSLDTDNSVVLKSEVDGRINRILVREGDRVPQGQVIMELSKDDLEAELLQAKARLANAQAQLSLLEAGNRGEDIAEARARLAENQARLNNAKQGARPEEIAQAEAQLEAAQAEAELATQRLQRYQVLRQEGAISEDEFQDLLQRQRSTSAAVREAERRLEEIKKSRQSDIDEIAAQVEQSEQNLIRLQRGARSEEIAQARANVAEAIAQVRTIEVRINKTRITAPLAGTIGNIPVKVSDYITAGEQVTTVTENDNLEVNLNIPIEKVPQLRLGQAVEVLNSQGEVIARGEISFISREVNPNLQQVLAKATINNVTQELLSQQFVKTKVIVGQRPGVLVPAAAISRLGGQTYVFVAEQSADSSEEQPQLIAKQRAVNLGSLQGNDYQIVEGIEPGEKIVTAGILQLQDGALIQPLPEE